jgi:hypothetical protein
VAPPISASATISHLWLKWLGFEPLNTPTSREKQTDRASPPFRVFYVFRGNLIFRIRVRTVRKRSVSVKSA